MDDSFARSRIECVAQIVTEMYAEDGNRIGEMFPPIREHPNPRRYHRVAARTPALRASSDIGEEKRDRARRKRGIAEGG
jgi:hypothetical protein